MPAKTMRYVLIAGVIFIWGTILYKIITGMSDTSVLPVKTATRVTPLSTLKQEDYYLFANYPDPFLIEAESDSSIIKAYPTVTSSPAVPAAPVIPEKPDLSFIQYHGTISNRERKMKIALVSFRGTELLVKEKDRRDEVLFRKIYPDKLEIVYNGKQFTINKN